MTAEAVKYSCRGETFEIELVEGWRGEPHYWGNRRVHEEEVEAAIHGMTPNGALQLLSFPTGRDTYDRPRTRILKSKDDTAVLFIASTPEEARILSGVVERLCDTGVLVHTGEVHSPDSSSIVGAKYQRTDKKAPRTQRRSIGHGRVLPPGQRGAQAARILARQLVVKAARRLRREGFLARRLTLSADCLDAPRWTASKAFAKANDDRACLGALAVLWTQLAEARPHATLFRIAVSFDRFLPSSEVQIDLPFGEPGNRRRGAVLTATVDAINGRYGRTVIGYGQCGEPGGYAGAKIAYGRIPAWEDFR